jgi:hypothetical protein
MGKAHQVVNVSFAGDRMLLAVDGREYEIDIAHHSRKLADASPAQKRNFVVSPSGYGIHWPDLDEDLSIDGLIGVRHPCPLKTTPAE